MVIQLTIVTAVYLLQAMPGTPPLETAAPLESLAPKLARAAGAVAVLGLGLVLVVAPGAVLGNLFSVEAESVSGERIATD